MEGIWEAIIALLAAAGLFSLGWFIIGKKVLADPFGQDTTAFTVLLVTGSAEGLYETLKRFRWMGGSAGVSPQVLLVDMGLTQEGVRIVERMSQKAPNLLFLHLDEVSPYLSAMAQSDNV